MIIQLPLSIKIYRTVFLKFHFERSIFPPSAGLGFLMEITSENVNYITLNLIILNL